MYITLDIQSHVVLLRSTYVIVYIPLLPSNHFLIMMPNNQEQSVCCGGEKATYISWVRTGTQL